MAKAEIFTKRGIRKAVFDTRLDPSDADGAYALLKSWLHDNPSHDGAWIRLSGRRKSKTYRDAA